MALFLSESYTAQPTMSLEEAQMDLLAVFQETAELNEAILQADFIIHEQSKYLTEEEKDKKEGGFFKNAAQKIKETAKKVWNAISNFFKSLIAKIKGLFGRAVTVSMHKGTFEAAKKLVNAVTKFANDAGKAVKLEKAEDIQNGVKTAKEELTKAEEAFDEIVKKEKTLNDHEKVSVKAVGILQTAATEAEIVMKRCEDALTKAEAEAAKAEAEATTEEGKKAAGEKLALAKARISAVQGVTRVGAVATKLGRLVIANASKATGQKDGKDVEY